MSSDHVRPGQRARERERERERGWRRVKIKEIYSRNLSGCARGDGERERERVFDLTSNRQEEHLPRSTPSGGGGGGLRRSRAPSGNIVSLMALKKIFKRRY